MIEDAERYNEWCKFKENRLTYNPADAFDTAWVYQEKIIDLYKEAIDDIQKILDNSTFGHTEHIVQRILNSLMGDIHYKNIKTEQK